MNRPEAIQLPCNVEAEQAVIGAVMLAGKRALDEVDDIIDHGMFIREEHSLIWRAIKAMAERDRSFDPVTLGAWFERKGLSEQVSSSYLVELATTTPSAANARGYAKLVKEKHVLRRIADAGATITGMAFRPNGMDSIDIVAQAQTIVGDLLANEPCEAEPLSNAIDEAWNEVSAERTDGGGLDGESTGYSDLDDIILGMIAGVYYLAARPKMGKSTLAQNIAEFFAMVRKRRVHIVTLEMKPKQFAKRMLASQADVNSMRIRTGQLEDDEWARLSEAVRDLKRAPITITKPRNASIPHICAQVRREHSKNPLGLVVLDYLQLADMPIERGETRSDAVARASRTLVLLAQELGIPVLVLSQLNRKVEERPNKRPMPSDLRDSGAIEQDAEAVIFLYRDEVYHSDSAYKGTVEVIVALSRNGPPGECRLLYRADRYRMEPLPFGWEPERPVKKEGKTRKGAFGKDREVAE